MHVAARRPVLDHGLSEHQGSTVPQASVFEGSITSMVCASSKVVLPVWYVAENLWIAYVHETWGHSTLIQILPRRLVVWNFQFGIRMPWDAWASPLQTRDSQRDAIALCCAAAFSCCGGVPIGPRAAFASGEHTTRPCSSSSPGPVLVTAARAKRPANNSCY